MQRTELVMAVALVLTLSGCGGGGGSSNPSGLPPANTTIPVPPSVQSADGSAFAISGFDGDSSAVDPNGNLVIDSQQDSALIFISNLGAANQAVSVLPMTLYVTPWPLDETRWSPASGLSFMLVSDNKGQIIYRIDAPGGFKSNTAFSAGQGTVLQSNTTTGVMTPIFVGMNSPHGLIFVTPP